MQATSDGFPSDGSRPRPRDASLMNDRIRTSSSVMLAAVALLVGACNRDSQQELRIKNLELRIKNLEFGIWNSNLLCSAWPAIDNLPDLVAKGLHPGVHVGALSLAAVKFREARRREQGGQLPAAERRELARDELAAGL
jgi:hypothetical protein